MNDGLLKIQIIKPSKDSEIPVIANYREISDPEKPALFKEHFSKLDIYVDTVTGEPQYKILEEKEFLGIGDPFLIRYQRMTTENGFDSVITIKRSVAAFRERPELLLISHAKINEEYETTSRFEESLKWKFVGFDPTYSVAVFRNSEFKITESPDLTNLKSALGGN